MSNRRHRAWEWSDHTPRKGIDFCLDVHFISSLPGMQGSVYKASVESKPAQMVGAEGYTTLFPGAAGGGSD